MTSLTLEDVTYRVRKIVADHSGSFPERIGLDATMDDCGFDSLDRYQLVIAAEDEFRIYIPEEDVFGDRMTVTEVITYVARKVGAK